MRLGAQGGRSPLPPGWLTCHLVLIFLQVVADTAIFGPVHVAGALPRRATAAGVSLCLAQPACLPRPSPAFLAPSRSSPWCFARQNTHGLPICLAWLCSVIAHCSLPPRGATGRQCSLHRPPSPGLSCPVLPCPVRSIHVLATELIATAARLPWCLLPPTQSRVLLLHDAAGGWRPARSGRQGESQVVGMRCRGAALSARSPIIEPPSPRLPLLQLRSDFWPTFSAELTVWPVVQVGRWLAERLGWAGC